MQPVVDDYNYPQHMSVIPVFRHHGWETLLTETWEEGGGGGAASDVG